MQWCWQKCDYCLPFSLELEVRLVCGNLVMSGEDPDGVKLANANGTASPAQIEQWKRYKKVAVSCKRWISVSSGSWLRI